MNPTSSIVSIPIDRIIPSKTNPRQTFPENEIRELSENIKQKGIIEPLLLRPSASEYEIVNGERRYKAAKLAGLKEVPADIRKLNDEQVIEIQMIGFLQRKDIHPLDEAEALMRLLGKTGKTLEVTAKVGKSQSYVEQRLKLIALIDPAKKAFRAEVLTIAHAILICRLQPGDQKRAFEFAMKNWQKFGGDYEYSNPLNPGIEDESDKNKYGHPDAARTVCSVKDLREFIEARINLDLSQAAFDIKDKELIKTVGSCIDCPKRTGFNKELFNDISKGDFCLSAWLYCIYSISFGNRCDV